MKKGIQCGRMLAGQMSGEGMEEISELESRLKDALELIDAAIGDGEGLADIVELRQQNAELKAGMEAAEQAADEARARMAEATAELELARNLSGAVSDTGEIVESITRAQRGLDGRLKVVQTQLDDALGKIADLAHQVQDFVQSVNGRLPVDGSHQDQSDFEAEIGRLRRIRQDDVNHINGILERLLPLVEGERGA